MDAIDILGSLLGGGSRGNSASRGGSSGGGGGLGGKILGELLKGATGGGRAQQPAPQPSRTSSGTNLPPRQIDIDREAQSLEELLGVATGRGSAPTSRPSSGQTTYRPAPEPPRYQPQPPPAPAPTRSAPPNQTLSTDDEAVVLIRALINAAKADGRIDANEQQAILSQVPDDPQTIQFLKQEFAQPLDVRDFAWSVPLGLEVKVYTMSLAGMRLDTNTEAQYLRELAHGLRMDPDVCRQIHQRYGLQDIF